MYAHNLQYFEKIRWTFVQAPHQVQTIALSPDGALLVVVDTEARALLVLRHTQVLLHRWTLKGECRAAAFSPNGRYIALAVGKLLQVRRGRPVISMDKP
jgi:acyl-CoA thioesterase FadM